MRALIFFTGLGLLATAGSSPAPTIYPMGRNVTGIATFYGAAGNEGTCSFTSMPVKWVTVAMADSQWFGANICGACLQVYGPNVYGKLGNVTKVMVTNQCPRCSKNHLDLDPKAFAVLAPMKQGIINNVKWKIIPCHHPGPVYYKFKEGVSQWWFALQGTWSWLSPLIRVLSHAIVGYV
ncbi:RlpA-like double-psi beta-barrel-protein domain-containing protein-containing protein [Jimgerdemannia flammicorona]|uniref:RlpA-like double-psi beta-barrel-protein domain-containing protein-containing protein n=1 Tax=Jimgerdemannia flammicorona TaxID=994334 RepID=A0A433D9V0_9FUNG|nr:RlpA-like double-psi beta-barrel-protein domain-containing protein-containing protein [Jimgerdemannia flammicorona]